MNIVFGKGTTAYGPGVSIEMSGEEVALAITAWLVAHGVHISGSRTIRLNDEFCEKADVYVDPSGFVMAPDGRRWNGIGRIDD